MEEKNYNGWKNRETWNVMLWINNDEPLYRACVKYVEESKTPSYAGFIEHMGLVKSKTPDGVKWISGELDFIRLDEAIRETATK